MTESWMWACVSVSADMRSAVLFAGMFVVAFFFAPALATLWIYTGAANSNFYYAFGLVHSFALVSNPRLRLSIKRSYSTARDQWKRLFRADTAPDWPALLRGAAGLRASLGCHSRASPRGERQLGKVNTQKERDVCFERPQRRTLTSDRAAILASSCSIFLPSPAGRIDSSF